MNETYIIVRTPARPDLPDDQRWMASGTNGANARGATPLAALARLCRDALPAALRTPREPGLNPEALPDLYAALKGLLPMWQSGIKEPWVEAAEAAIAKAHEEPAHAA